MNNTTNILLDLPSKSVNTIKQCVDVTQLSEGLRINDMITGLFYQKIISNLYLFFTIGIFLLNIAFFFYHKQHKQKDIFAKRFNTKSRVILSISFMSLIGANAMITFIRTLTIGNNIWLLVPFLAIFLINFMLLFFNFFMFFLPLGINIIDKIRRVN